MTSAMRGVGEIVVTQRYISAECAHCRDGLALNGGGVCMVCNGTGRILVPRPPVTADEIAMAETPRFGATAAVLLGICGALLGWLLVEIWPWIWSLLR